MSKLAIPNGLYALADSQFGDPFEHALRLSKAGCVIIQIRAKDWSCDELIARGQSTVSTLRRMGVLIIINDHIRACQELNASGVHLGQEDTSPQAARHQLGPDYIIGLSTHSVSQAAVAAQTGVNYIGFGPIFSTSTKQNPGTPVGLNALAKAVRTTPLPVIAIGGVHTRYLKAIRATGVHGWAAASALAGNDSLRERVLAFS